MNYADLQRLAQDAGFVINALGEIVVPAPGSDATEFLRRFAVLAKKAPGPKRAAKQPAPQGTGTGLRTPVTPTTMPGKSRP